MIDLKVTDKLTGAFKTGHEAQLEFRNKYQIPTAFDNTKVCAKQLYQRSANGSIRRYRGHGEAVALVDECRSLDWAAILLKLTYDFVNAGIEQQGPPPFQIPTVRFIRSMLAVSDDSKEKSFLLEEWINTSNDNRFMKYINNSIPTSCVPPSAPRKAHERAEFLCFAQHVQWRLTGYLAFTSDYQGTPPWPPSRKICY